MLSCVCSVVTAPGCVCWGGAHSVGVCVGAQSMCMLCVAPSSGGCCCVFVASSVELVRGLVHVVSCCGAVLRMVYVLGRR